MEVPSRYFLPRRLLDAVAGQLQLRFAAQIAAEICVIWFVKKLNGRDPYAYLNDVLIRLRTRKNNAIDELLPYNWKPAIADKVW